MLCAESFDVLRMGWASSQQQAVDFQELGAPRKRKRMFDPLRARLPNPRPLSLWEPVLRRLLAGPGVHAPPWNAPSPGSGRDRPAREPPRLTLPYIRRAGFAWRRLRR